MSSLLVLAIGVGGSALPQAPPPAATVALAALVDMPTTEARSKMARELATRADVTLSQWLEAARALPLRRDEPAAMAGRTVISLCRCGHSANKPFCDGGDARQGFQSMCEARELPPPKPKM